MAAVDAHFKGETDRYKAEFRVKAKNGSWLWMGNYGQIKERNEKGEVTQFIGVSFNIDQRRMMEETMKAMAFSDALTGLGNRRLLFEKAGDLIAKSYVNNLPTTLLIADIDYFKKINDTYGHSVGDQVLISYSEVLKTYFREIDMKIRYGGDEFIILLPDTSLKQAEASAHRLNNRIAKIESDVKEGITTSVGLAELQSNETIEHLIQRADKALYQAKQLGRNTVVIDS
jgi:diguanylate cyclase (GGDEF)-like protein